MLAGEETCKIGAVDWFLEIISALEPELSKNISPFMYLKVKYVGIHSFVYKFCFG